MNTNYQFIPSKVIYRIIEYKTRTIGLHRRIGIYHFKYEDPTRNPNWKVYKFFKK